MVTRKPGPPKRDRTGWYVTPRGRFPSVTTIISQGMPKPALVHWAAWEAATCAVDNIPELVKARGQQARDELRGWIQRASERKRDTAADLGSVVHGIVEARLLGQPTPELTEEQVPFVEAFDRFLDTWQPQFEAAELTVVNDVDGYAGTLDAIARIPALTDELLVLDWKTGKAVYPEVGLQLAAYRRATVAYTRPDGVEVPMPETVGGMVLHLRPEGMPGGEPGGYALRNVRTDEPVYGQFLTAKATAEALRKDGLLDQVLSEPIASPSKTEEQQRQALREAGYDEDDIEESGVLAS